MVKRVDKASAKGEKTSLAQGPGNHSSAASAAQKKPASPERPSLRQRTEGLKPDELNAANDK